jgi:hypothetical protein
MSCPSKHISHRKKLKGVLLGPKNRVTPSEDKGALRGMDLQNEAEQVEQGKRISRMESAAGVGVDNQEITGAGGPDFTSALHRVFKRTGNSRSD